MKNRLSAEKKGQIKSAILAGRCDPESVDLVVGRITEIVECKKPPRKRGRKPVSNKQLADILTAIENARKRNRHLASKSSLANALFVNRKKINRALNSREAELIVFGRKNYHLFKFKKFRPVCSPTNRITRLSIRNFLFD